jgi:hypothetical protein
VVSATWESIGRWIVVQASLGKNVKSYLKTKAIGLEVCLNMLESPEFKPQSHKKKKKKSTLKHVNWYKNE